LLTGKKMTSARNRIFKTNPQEAGTGGKERFQAGRKKGGKKRGKQFWNIRGKIKISLRETSTEGGGGESVTKGGGTRTAKASHYTNIG